MAPPQLQQPLAAKVHRARVEREKGKKKRREKEDKGQIGTVHARGIDCMMSSSIFLLCCLLTFSIYSLSQHTGYSLETTPARKLSMSVPVHDHKTQGADKAMESTPANQDSMTTDYKSNSYSPHDLVYHIDYHGVTTHPTPKHPKP
ncbi:hypothetical protein E2542_SST18908 [Spatholobus suberectus]|nr:hypothetical protein E2542_SST18908 [Spatholobus suberectus]